MSTRFILYVFVLILMPISFSFNSSDENFNEIYNLTTEKNFFLADSLFRDKKSKMGEIHQRILQVQIDNAFNKNRKSLDNISYLLKTKADLPDSLVINLYRTKMDNELKLFKYKSAMKTLDVFLKDYADHLSEVELEDLKNSQKIYSALQNVPAQTIHKNKDLSIQMVKDIAGLNNLPVYTAKDSTNFIFDTGANLSVISETTSQKLGVKMLPDSNIDVDALTGGSVKAQLGWISKLHIEHITLNNVVFLVFKDVDLAFPSINYQINGILGYPVIEALGEIHLGKDGSLKVPHKLSPCSNGRNLALDELTPLVQIDKLLYTFDTGASNTMLYSEYYYKNKEYIDKNYVEETIQLGGAGGTINYQGYNISHTIDDFNRKITLKATVLKDKEQKYKYIIGNLGQDYLGQFDTIILNFKSMCIQLK